MKLNEQKFALAAAGSMAIFYTGCALFVFLWPKVALKLTADILHLSSLDQFTSVMSITIGNFLSGLIQLVFYTYLFFFPMAWLYNYMMKRK